MDEIGEIEVIFDGESSEDEFEDVLNQLAYRKPKVFKAQIDNFRLWEEEEFIGRYRVTKDVAQLIARALETQLRHSSNKNFAVEPQQQVLIALGYYASGSFLRCVGDMAGLHKSTVCRIIKRVTHHLANLRNEFISMPTNEEQRLEVAKKFYDIARFPKVIGAIDCTHVPLLSPGGNNAEDFRNRKGWFSLNVQVIGDADLCINNIVARWPGSAHDSHIFNSSNIKGKLENGDFDNYWLVGDSGYAVKPYLLTPLSNPVSREERLYNESQIRTRNTIERLFGVWKRRFPVIGTRIRNALPNVEGIIVATAVLHNICRILNVRQPPDFVEIAEEIPAEDINVGLVHNNDIRTQLINSYFQRL